MATNKVSVEVLKDSSPIIVIPWDVALDIDTIVDAKTVEIGWIGEVERSVENPRHFVVTKITVPEQEVNGGTTEISGEGIYNASEAEEDFNLDKFRYWGHSHGNIQSVNPSSQDDLQMREFADTCEWFIGTIHNRQGKVFGYAIDTVKGLYYRDIPVIFEQAPELVSIEMEIYALEEKMEKMRVDLVAGREARDWAQVIKQRVATKTYNNQNAYRGGYNNQQAGFHTNVKPKVWDPEKRMYVDNVDDKAVADNKQASYTASGDVTKVFPLDNFKRKKNRIKEKI